MYVLFRCSKSSGLTCRALATFYVNPQTQALCDWIGVENNLIQ